MTGRTPPRCAWRWRARCWWLCTREPTLSVPGRWTPSTNYARSERFYSPSAFMSSCLSFSISLCLSVSISLCLCLPLSLCLCLPLSVCLCHSVSLCLFSLSLSLCLFSPSVCVCARARVYECLCVCVCLSLFSSLILFVLHIFSSSLFCIVVGTIHSFETFGFRFQTHTCIQTVVKGKSNAI